MAGIPGSDLIQYGMGAFALGAMAYITATSVKARRNGGGNGQDKGGLAQVVENNTNAITDLRVFLAGALANQDAKLDELIRRLPPG